MAAKNATLGDLAGINVIKPMVLWFKCSTLTNWATVQIEASRAVTASLSTCIYNCKFIYMYLGVRVVIMWTWKMLLALHSSLGWTIIYACFGGLSKTEDLL